MEIYETQISVSICKVLFKPRNVIYVLSTDAFVLLEQSQMVALETVWSAKP